MRCRPLTAQPMEEVLLLPWVFLLPNPILRLRQTGTVQKLNCEQPWRIRQTDASRLSMAAQQKTLRSTRLSPPRRQPATPSPIAGWSSLNNAVRPPCPVATLEACSCPFCPGRSRNFMSTMLAGLISKRESVTNTSSGVIRTVTILDFANRCRKLGKLGILSLHISPIYPGSPLGTTMRKD